MSTSELLTYFTAEKQGAIVLAVLGIVSVIFGVNLWRTTRWLTELSDRLS